MIGPCKKGFTKNMADNGNYVFHSQGSHDFQLRAWDFWLRSNLKRCRCNTKESRWSDIGPVQTEQNCWFRSLFFQRDKLKWKCSKETKKRRLTNWLQWSARRGSLSHLSEAWVPKCARFLRRYGQSPRYLSYSWTKCYFKVRTLSKYRTTWHPGSTHLLGCGFFATKNNIHRVGKLPL